MQNGFSIHSSNRLEILAGELAGILREPPAGALEAVLRPETIVVQSKGMERWLSLAICRYNGICANYEFPFPNAFLDTVFKKVLNHVSPAIHLNPPRLTFRIMAILPDVIHTPEFEPVRRYLAEDPDQRKRFQLSRKIADTFDQYLVFRPEMIASWETGKMDGMEAGWQATLWRAVMDNDASHRARLQSDFLYAVKGSNIDISTLPPRLFIFGISYLPLFHLRVMAALATVIPVHFFLLNPCREYWGDIVSDAEQKRIRARYDDSDTAGGLALESGNRILASLGGMGRDFFSLLTEMDAQFYESYEMPPDDTMLGGIQGDILDLQERWRPPADEDSVPSLIPPNVASDDSIEIHSCHSPMREIEVLYDRLLAMFDANAELTPKDILVMAPDIDTYAAYIEAVFNTPETPSRRIPYSIADQSLRKERRVVNDFLNLLELKHSRLGATRIMTLLESPHIRETWELSDNDMEMIMRWVLDTRIRWGSDEHFKTSLGLPGFEEHTWRHGMNRMLLGYALPGKDERLFSGILPYDHIEGKEGLVLGRFIAFLERLFSFMASLDTAKPLHQWADLLQGALNSFFSGNDDQSGELRIIRDQIAELREIEQVSQNSEPITFEVVCDYMKQPLSTPVFGSGFISGGVTFCSMLPMRSIPAKVICMIGMQNDAFPRESHFPSFNLIAASPRPGDRSRRSDDKYLFLEAIISARKKLYISYVGQSIQDNAAIPPSGLVSELMDYLKEGFGKDPESLLTRHRLQAFSSLYFKEDSPLSSYSAENLRASRSLTGPKSIRQFFTKQLPEPPEDFQRLGGSGFIRFFTNPCKYLLEERLGIKLRGRSETIEDREVFSLNALDRFRIGQELLEVELSGKDLDDHLAVQRAKGNLPTGKVGELAFQQLRTETQDFKEKITPCIGTEIPVSKSYRFTVGKIECRGTLNHIYPNAMIHIRFGNTRPADLLSAFIQHLILSHLDDNSLPAQTFLLCKDSGWRFKPVPEAEEILGRYLDYYWEGLQRPLPFFPRTSHEYARRILINGETPLQAMTSAQKKWLGNDRIQGEAADLHHRLCFSGRDPLGMDFQETALGVFGPLLEACSEMFI